MNKQIIEEIEEIKRQIEEIKGKKKKKIIVYKERLDMVLFIFAFILLTISINITRAIEIIDKINPTSSILSLFIIVALIILLSYMFAVIIKFSIIEK